MRCRILTLPSSVNRYCRCLKIIQPVIGSTRPHTAVDFYEVTRIFPSIEAYSRSLAEASHKLSFVEMLREADEAEADKVFILEDDAVPAGAFSEGILSAIEKELPEDFGICVLGCYMRPGSTGRLTKYSEHLLEFERKPGNPIFKIWGSHSIIFSKKVYAALIKILSAPGAPVTDKAIYDNILPAYKCFLADPILFFQDHGSGKDPSAIHGEFSFAKMEEETLEYIKRRRIN